MTAVTCGRTGQRGLVSPGECITSCAAGSLIVHAALPSVRAGAGW
jgi:hypothetical protein